MPLTSVALTVFVFAVTVAAATLAGFTGNPLAIGVAGALLKERLSTDRYEQVPATQEPTATEGLATEVRLSWESRPSSPNLPGTKSHSELGDEAHTSQEEPEVPDLNQGTANSLRSESAPLSELQDNSGWVMIGQAPRPAHPISALSDSTRSLSAVSSSPPASAPGVYARDFANPSSSSLGSSAALAQAQVQAQASRQPSPSIASFVTALTSDRSPRSSVVSWAPFGIANRCESPNPVHPFRRPLSARRPPSLRVSIAADTACDLVDGVCRLTYEHRCQVLGPPSAVEEESSESAQVANSDPTRRALIIGNSYRRDTREIYSMYSITTLPGAENDIPLLKEVLERRGYVVEILNQDGFHRDEVLNRVAAFLCDAKPGNIRAVAFIGHACVELDGTIVLVPPHCPTPEMAIPQADWERTIRTNAKAGSIVLSIMAHCFSGDFMKQKQNCQNWDPTGLVPHPHPAVDKPIFITFASSTKNQSSFESTVERTDPERAQDHFLYALAMTMKADEVRTWEAFFAAFRHHFDRARSGASWAERFDLQNHLSEEAVPASEREHIFAWRPANRQDPSFSASEILSYSNMFQLPSIA